VDGSEFAIKNEAVARTARVVGCVLLNDLSVPHDSYYRPPVKFKCLDGFLGIGPRCVPLTEVGDLNTLKLEVRINGALRQTWTSVAWCATPRRCWPTSTPS
jgi:2-keto-4-pentenoate hydratase/2-oxohepta-3-ene-1,7-dioic acid hydratase in catechol pathway